MEDTKCNHHNLKSRTPPVKIEQRGRILGNRRGANVTTRKRNTLQSGVFFDPSDAPFMVNYIVDDVDALIERLEQEGVKD